MQQKTNRFSEGLKLFNFEVGSASSSNLLLTSHLSNKNFSAEDLFLLETARNYSADAIYVRRFSDHRSSIAQIYIYDNTKNKLDQAKISEIHRKLWSSCVIPIFIIINTSSILVYDSRSPVEIQNDKLVSNPIKTLEFAAESVKLYSAQLLDSGLFWELKENRGHFLSTTSAYDTLIDGLKKIRTKFISESELPVKTAHKLLVQSILIKYLEERGTEGESVFAKTFFKKNFDAKDFCDVLRKKGRIIDLFSKLSEQFNGKVFEWNDKAEIKKIKETDLSPLASYLDGDNINNQYVMWRLYSFAHLPVELISTVYEEFLGKEKKDVVYTPDFLVTLLIEEALPLTEHNSKFKLIDGSCGSGIFLVKGFKRLVQRWRYNQFLETGELQTPNLKALKQILKESVFGVDIEDDAVRLSVFSLALALCDMLTPKQIWTELKFDNLFENNIQCLDFFDFSSDSSNYEKFDLIIGNPPFKELNKNEYDQILKDNDISVKTKIPQNQIALLYLDMAMRLIKNNSNLCLILPAGPILYNETVEFRTHYFDQYEVSQIIDFTNLSSNLFGKANVAVVALFAKKLVPTDSAISHITVRETFASKQKLYFEVDHYDFHWVTKEDARTDKYIWKANLLGGGRLSTLISRLSQLPSLREYLELKVNENSWVVGEGFMRGSPKDNTADYITNKKAVLAKNFKKVGYSLEKVDAKYFIRRRTKELFTAPLLLIKEIIETNHIPTALLYQDTPFDSRIVGIHCPTKQKGDLEELHRTFNASMKTYVFFIIGTSSQSLVSFATAIQKKDIMNLPYPSESKKLKLSTAEKIIRDDVLNFHIHYLLKGDTASVNHIASFDEIEVFSEVFCKAINSAYSQDNKAFILTDVYESPSFFATTFKYGKLDAKKAKKHKLESEDLISHLSLNLSNSSLKINRVLKVYEEGKITLIKPKRVRYWLKSIALRDVDETLDEILDAQ